MIPPVEAQVFSRVADDYRRRGYEVEVEPSADAVPEFLRGLHPGLIARRPGDSVVVEVKVGTKTSVAERFREIAERVNKEPGWRFSLVFASPDEPNQITEAEPAPRRLLEQRTQNAEDLLSTGQNEAAFLLLWSALEGILRHLGERAQLPLANLPPSALMRELYSAGEISREEFEMLVGLFPLRNQLVHGFGLRADLEAGQLLILVKPLLAGLRRT